MSRGQAVPLRRRDDAAAHQDRDRGETLLELLVTISIIGVSVVALLGAVLIAVDASTLDRRQIQAQGLLRSWSEAVVRATTDATYPTCGDASDYASGPFAFGASGLAAPAGFSATVVSVEYFTRSTGTWVSSSSVGTCTASDDQGLQRVTLRMTVANSLYPGFAVDQAVVVRKPCDTVNGSGIPTC
jgi:type II secretory pathway pseudopilin PulG